MADAGRTQYAMQALSLAEYFQIKVGDKAVGGYRVELAVPDGPSTGGGKQAVQHIRLVPGGNGPVITAGAANPVSKSCELRTYEHLAQLHAQRFRGKKLPLDRVAYNQLLERMKAFFAESKLSVVLVDAAALPEIEAAPPSRASLLALLAAIVLALGGGLFFFFSRR